MADQNKKSFTLPWRRIGIVSCILLAIFIGVSSAALVYLNSDTGRKNIAEFVNENLADEESSVYISEINGSLFSKFNIPIVTISDRNGVWLEAHQIEADWSVFSILSGTVFVSELAIDTVNVMRAPVASQSEPTAVEPFELPSLPFDVEIESYNVSKIMVSEALADVASELNLSGVVKLTESDGVIAQANLVSNGDYDDAIRIDVSYPRDATDLLANIEINAPENGLFVALSGLDPKEAITVNFNGNGPIENWEGQIHATVGQDEIVRGFITHLDGSLKLHADFDVRKFLSDDLAPLVGDMNSIDVEYKNSTIDATLISKLAQLNITGMETIDFTLELLNLEPINQIIAPAFLKPTTVTGTLENIDENPNLDVLISNLEAGAQDSVEAVINGQISVVQNDQVINIESNGSITDINGSSVEAVKGLLDGGINWNVNSQLDQQSATMKIADITLENEVANISGAGDFNSQNGAIDFDLNATVDSILDIATRLNINQNFSGAALLNAKVMRQNVEDPIDVELVLNTENIDLDNPVLNELLGSEPAFVSHISQSQDGAVQISDTRLDASVLKFNADANLSPGQMIDNANFSLSLSDIENVSSMQDMALSGDIDVIGSLSGNLQSPSVQIETGFKSLNIQNLELQDFAATISADDIVNAPQGTVSITSGTNFGALDMRVSFAGEQNNYQIPEMNLTFGAYQASGVFERMEDKPITGELNILTTEVENNDAGVRGVITAKVTLTDEDNIQKIFVDGAVSDVFVPANENELITLKSATITSDALLLSGMPQVTLNAEINGLMHPSFQSQLVDINVEQVNNGLRYFITAQGANSMPFDFEIDGDVITTDGDGNNITVGLAGTVGGTEIGLMQPVRINLLNDNIIVLPFSLMLGEGQIDGELNKQADNIQANISMNHADLSPIQVFAPDIPLSGLLSGNMELSGTKEDIASGFDLQLSSIIFKDQGDAISNDIEMSLRGVVTDKNTEISGQLKLNDIFDADYAVTLPLTIEPVTFATELPDDQLISGHFNWQGDVTPIWPLFQLIDHDLTGVLDAGFTLGGTLNEPDIDGRIGMTDGRYENMQTGFVASNLEMNATITDRHFILDRFSASDGEEGTINATADINVAPDLSYAARADLILENAQLVRQPELQIAASSNLTFIKTPENTSLSGDITVENATIGAVEQGGPAIAKLDVTEINAEGTVAAKEEEEDALGVIDLDLKIHVPNQLFIVSFGLDSEWQSDLTVTGTSEEPIIGGTAEVVRGFFEFSGKRFDLKRGNFTFPNDKSNDPIIEIMAEHELSDMIANLRIFGQASKPTIEMSATPYLPENEVLARILFGTSVAELTAVEAVQLASAVHSLSNGGGQGLMGGVRRAIGVDRLSIDNDSSREYGTTITGGKYLTDNVYVEVSTAPSTGETATSVEVDLTRSLSVVTKRTLDHDNNLSIKWSWDY